MKHEHILVVDDEAIIRKSISANLLAEGYQVSTAQNGEEAVAALKMGSFDLVVTDLVMPGLDGIELLKQTKSLAPSIPVLILTGQGDLDSAIKALRSGADDYILKPCDIDELLERISRCLERRQYISRGKTGEDLPQNNLRPEDILTKRELEIMKLVAQGFTNKDIGHQLFISPRTVDKHRSNMMVKLSVNSARELTILAIKSGLIEIT